MACIDRSRSGWSLGPPVSRSSRRRSRACNSAGDNTLLRAAASSMASGSRSSSEQIDSTNGVVVSSSREAGTHGARSRHEQCHRVVGIERRNDDLVLAAKVQRLAARHQNRDPRCERREVRRRIRRPASPVRSCPTPAADRDLEAPPTDAPHRARSPCRRCRSTERSSQERGPDRSPARGPRNARRRRSLVRRAVPTQPRRPVASCRSRRDRGATPAEHQGSTTGRSPGRARRVGRGSTSSEPG